MDKTDMKKLLLLTLTAVLSITSAFACQRHYIREVADEIIILDDGSVYECFDPTAWLWLPMTNVLVCHNNKIINTDDGESVDAIQLR
jgi:hypothetical protein